MSPQPFSDSFHDAYSIGRPTPGSLAIEGIVCWEGKEEIFSQILFLILLPLVRFSKSVTLTISLNSSARFFKSAQPLCLCLKMRTMIFACSSCIEHLCTNHCNSKWLCISLLIIVCICHIFLGRSKLAIRQVTEHNIYV